MNKYLVYKANPIAEDEVEGAELIAQESFGEPTDIQDAATRHDYNASEVCRFLSHLPQGTLERVMVKLMEARVSQFVVREEQFRKALAEED